MASPAPPPLSLHAVTKVYPGRVAALQGVSLSVPYGERACLLGPNGAGKTTIVRLLQGALQPTSGTVTVAGVRAGSPEFVHARASLGIVPQLPGMYDDLRLAEYLTLVQRLSGRGDPEMAADQMGLRAFLTRPLAALSGGLQRRAVLAAALLPAPPILILDEPTVGLDPIAAREVRAQLIEAMAGRTVLLCTHNLPEAEALSQSVIILREGRVLLHERIDALRARIGTRVRLRATQTPEALSRAVAAMGYAPMDGPPGDDVSVTTIDVALGDPPRQVPPLLRGLLAANVDVYEAQVLRPTLEDLFFATLSDAAPRLATVASEGAAVPPQLPPKTERAAQPRSRRIAALMRKELTQLPRKRSAMVSATLLPLLLLLAMPVGQMLGLSRLPAGAFTARVPLGFPLPAVMETINRDPQAAFRLLTLPLVVLLGGLVLPTVMASHTIVVERERRTLDLLVALPVTLADVLWAKLLTVSLIGAAISLPLLLIDAAVGISLGFVRLQDSVALAFLLVCALLYSTVAALLVSLLAGDYRTANNVSGVLIGPLALVAIGLIFALPPGVVPLALSAILLALAALGLTISLRWVTVERFIR